MGTIKNVSSEDAVAKLRDLAESARICHFVTALNERPNSDRPMALQSVDDDGNLWFFSHRNSNKNYEIEQDWDVQLYFSNTSASE